MNLTPFLHLSSRFSNFGWAALTALSLCACGSVPQLAPPATAAAIRADDLAAPHPAGADQTLMTIDAGASNVSVHVFRAGRAARLGHNHVLNAPKLQGLVRLPSGEFDAGSASLELTLRLDELQLDAPAARAALGPGWASTLTPDMIAATRGNMLSEKGLQAETYPLLTLRSLHIGGALPKLAVLVEVELHGQRRQQWLALHVDLDSAKLRARGAMVLKQSDHGLTPFSVAGGLLSVQDELLIEFDLLARPPRR